MKTLHLLIITAAAVYITGLTGFLVTEAVVACARERSSQVRAITEAKVLAALDQTRREIELARAKQPQVMLMPMPEETPTEPERPSAWRDPLPRLRGAD